MQLPLIQLSQYIMDDTIWHSPIAEVYSGLDFITCFFSSYAVGIVGPYTVCPGVWNQVKKL